MLLPPPVFLLQHTHIHSLQRHNHAHKPSGQPSADLGDRGRRRAAGALCRRGRGHACAPGAPSTPSTSCTSAKAVFREDARLDGVDAQEEVLRRRGEDAERRCAWGDAGLDVVLYGALNLDLLGSTVSFFSVSPFWLGGCRGCRGG